MPDPLSPEAEAAIVQREQAATTGPWEVAPRSDDAEIAEVVADYSELPCGGKRAVWIAELDAQIDFDNDREAVIGQMADNAEFIAHARDDIPILLAELTRVRAERDRLRAALVEHALNWEDLCSEQPACGRCQWCRYAAKLRALSPTGEERKG